MDPPSRSKFPTDIIRFEMCDISKPVYYLIVTLFRRGPSRQDSEYSYRSSGLNQLSTLLNHLLQPSYLALHSIRHNEQRNTSAAYSVITDLLPVNIRANPDLTAFEAAHSVEMVVALYSSKDQHFIDEQPRFDLALFDMDSTLIQQEVIDELARSIGLFPAVSAITARAMNGEIDFETSLRERVALLRGVKTSVWEDLKTGGRITIMKGAKELVGRLRELGARTAVASGGFVPMAEWLKGELGLDYAFANHVGGQYDRTLLHSTSISLLGVPLQYCSDHLSSKHPDPQPTTLTSTLPVISCPAIP